MTYSRRTVDLNNVARLWNIFAGLHICCLGGHVRRDQAPAAENVSGNCIKSLRDSSMPRRGSSVKQFTDSAAARDKILTTCTGMLRGRDVSTETSEAGWIRSICGKREHACGHWKIVKVGLRVLAIK